MFYLDYGNIEWVDAVYDWNSLCDLVPIQAIVLKIHGMIDLVEFFRLNCRQQISPVERIEQFLWKNVNAKFKAIVQ